MKEKQGIAAEIRVPPFWTIGADAHSCGLSKKGDTQRIALSPGAGWGSGSHETTQLCLQAIALFSPRQAGGFRMLDFGSGSAILSIGAAKLGARVEGVEIDEAAIENAVDNVRLNGVEGSIRFSREIQSPAGSCDLVVANILRPVLIQFAPDLVKRLTPRACSCFRGWSLPTCRSSRSATRNCSEAASLRSTGEGIGARWCGGVALDLPESREPVLKKYKRINIEISNVCNLSCSFCPEVHRQKKVMSEDLFRKVLAQVAPLTEEVCLHLMGEPLGHPRLSEFVDLCAEYGVPINLTSNGTLLNEKRQEILLRPIVRQVNFSVHSFEANFGERDVLPYMAKLFAFTRQAFALRPDLYINYRIWDLTDPCR